MNARAWPALSALSASAAIVATSLFAQERTTIGGQPQVNFPAPPITAAQDETARTKALDGYLSGLATEDRFAGVVLLAREGVVVFERAYGLADRAHNVANSTVTRFNLASVNKQFTIAALDLLMADGKLKAGDTVGALLPDYPNPQGRKATVEQLLGHRGGISDFFGDDFAAASPGRFRSNADYFNFVAPRPVYFEPGAQQRYCNGCYIVLGEIVSKLAGMPYERFVAEKIFAPRGMKSSGWLQSDEPAANVAMGYTRRLPGREGTLAANLLLRGASGSAAGGGYSTARDLFAFFKDGPTGKAESGPVAIGIGGGAPGSNALVESQGGWMAIVLSNLDPPSASVGVAILRALQR